MSQDIPPNPTFGASLYARFDLQTAVHNRTSARSPIERQSGLARVALQTQRLSHGSGTTVCRRRSELQESADPFSADDRLPDGRQRYRQHDHSSGKANEKQQSIFLEIGQRNQGDYQGGYDASERNGLNTTVMFSNTTTMPTRRLVVSGGVGQRGYVIFSRNLSTGTARCIKAAR